MSDLNKTIMTARLTKDPEFKISEGGTSILKFSVACGRFKKDEVDFWNCVCFGKLSEVMADILKKGKQIVLCGRMENSKYHDKEGIEKTSTQFKVDEITLVGKKDD